MIQIQKNKKYLITGGTGFLGEILVNKILHLGGNVRVVSRDEGKLLSLKDKFKTIEIYTGDISDSFEADQACKNIDGVFHLAAFKHVDLAEKFTRECIKTNIIGTINVLQSSLNNDIKFIIGVSTDKVASVKGVYGASKLLMESLFKQYEQLNNKTEYRVVRFGNVLYSTGSVLCKWKESLFLKNEISITDPNATRYFWTGEEAVQLIFDCMKNSKDSDPYVPKMKSMKIKNLAIAFAKKYLEDPSQLNIKYVGLRPGESLHEKIVENGISSLNAEEFTIEEMMEKI